MGIGSSADNYRDSMIKLSPTGKCWPTEEGTTWYTLLDALAQELARVDANGVLLLNESFPDTTSILLENWERILGLPDECSDTSATESERRNVLLGKIRARGGQSANYFGEVIEAMGLDNAVQDCTPFYCDEGEAGEHIFDTTWTHKFVITIQNGSDVPDETSFECRLNQLKPAHTVAFFVYD